MFTLAKFVYRKGLFIVSKDPLKFLLLNLKLFCVKSVTLRDNDIKDGRYESTFMFYHRNFYSVKM